jgi:hypothetical protein
MIWFYDKVGHLSLNDFIKTLKRRIRVNAKFDINYNLE